MIFPLFLIFAAVLLFAAAMRGNVSQLVTQAETDAKGFLALAIVILIVGAMGNIKSLSTLSNALLVLILVSYTIIAGKNIVTGLKAAS